MYQENKRERRRRDYLRMKDRARRVQARWWGSNNTDPDLDEASGRLANDLKCCSCYMCGNPRKWWNELTFQEIKANLDKNEQYNDFLKKELDKPL